MPAMPELDHNPARLRDAQFAAITNLERSLLAEFTALAESLQGIGVDVASEE